MNTNRLCIKNSVDQCVCNSCFYEPIQLSCDEEFQHMCLPCFINVEEYPELMCDRCVDLYRSWRVRS